MRYERFRKVPFVDREDEENFLVRWFLEEPSGTLTIYGPRNSGKTMLVKYVVEKRFSNSSSFWVKYLNLRGSRLSSYREFKYHLCKGIGTAESTSFTPVLIVDELQVLSYLETGGEEDLVVEFLNFCIQITKEEHIAHVVLVSSDSLFIESLYKRVGLGRTNQFFKVSHFEKSCVLEWLSLEGFSPEDAELTWDFAGGCPGDIFQVVNAVKRGENLKSFLERSAKVVFSRVVGFMGELTGEERQVFLELAEKLLERGEIRLDSDVKSDEESRVLKKCAQEEIFFYDPVELSFQPVSRLHERALERLFDSDTLLS